MATYPATKEPPRSTPIAAEVRGEFVAVGVGGEVICDIGPMGPSAVKSGEELLAGHRN